VTLLRLMSTLSQTLPQNWRAGVVNHANLFAAVYAKLGRNCRRRHRCEYFAPVWESLYTEFFMQSRGINSGKTKSRKYGYFGWLLRWRPSWSTNASVGHHKARNYSDGEVSQMENETVCKFRSNIKDICILNIMINVSDNEKWE